MNDVVRNVRRVAFYRMRGVWCAVLAYHDDADAVPVGEWFIVLDPKRTVWTLVAPDGRVAVASPSLFELPT